MSTVQNNVLYQSYAPVEDLSEKQISSPLKILIIAVAAIATAAFGFLLAGLVGLCVGALVGGGLAALCVTSCSPATQALDAEDIQPIIEEPELLNICPGPIADASILWIVGTESPYLAQMLALHRKENPDHGPALLRDRQPDGSLRDGLGRPGIYELGALTDFRKENPSKVILELLDETSWPAMTLGIHTRRAYALPGDKPHSTMGELFDDNIFTLKWSLASLGGVMNNAEKNTLKKHLQEHYIPIFSSFETLLQDLDRCPENKELVEKWRARTFSGHICNMFDDAKQIEKGLLATLDYECPLLFNEAERDLIDHPCPLVFASTSIGAPPLFHNDLRLKVTQNVLRFGEDIQYVYTTAPNIERIKSVLGPLNVEVRDLKTLAPAVEGQIS